MKEYMPYIVSIVVAIITGLASYFAASKKSKIELKALKESNEHEINRLMEQHKLNIDSIERAHQLELEKMELEHSHQLELKNKEIENLLTNNLLSSILDSAMKTPGMQQMIEKSFQKAIGPEEN